MVGDARIMMNLSEVLNIPPYINVLSELAERSFTVTDPIRQLRRASHPKFSKTTPSHPFLLVMYLHQRTGPYRDAELDSPWHLAHIPVSALLSGTHHYPA